jgi:hypothetical protein
MSPVILRFLLPPLLGFPAAKNQTTATLPFALYVNPLGSPVHVGVRPGRDAAICQTAFLLTLVSVTWPRLLAQSSFA